MTSEDHCLTPAVILCYTFNNIVYIYIYMCVCIYNFYVQIPYIVSVNNDYSHRTILHSNRKERNTFNNIIDFYYKYEANNNK